MVYLILATGVFTIEMICWGLSRASYLDTLLRVMEVGNSIWWVTSGADFFFCAFPTALLTCEICRRREALQVSRSWPKFDLKRDVLTLKYSRLIYIVSAQT